MTIDIGPWRAEIAHVPVFNDSGLDGFHVELRAFTCLVDGVSVVVPEGHVARTWLEKKLADEKQYDIRRDAGRAVEQFVDYLAIAVRDEEPVR